MRDLNKEAWFLYQMTSIEHFERCAQACQEFAEVFDQLMATHDAHGYANLDYWVKQYYSYAKKIRRHIELAELGDYIPILSTLNGAASSYRGMIDQPLGWMTDADEKKWQAAFDKVSSLCGYSNEVMENNEWAGITWLEREERKDEEDFPEKLNTDASSTVECMDSIDYLQENGLLPTPDHYPSYFVDKSRSCRAGETCPWTGVWVPEQALTEGLEKFSIAFAMAGRPMQPAYRIVDWMNIATDYSGDPETYAILGDSEPIYSPITKAEDALWYPVVQVESDTVAEAATPTSRLRAEPNDFVSKTGWWHSQAKPNGQALHYFEAGQRFPDWHTTNYGSVIWGYDPDEQKEPPKR